MGRRVKIAAALVGSLLVVGVAAGAVFALSFDPNSQKGRLVDAVRRATGRDLVLAGPLRLSFGLTPGIEAEDVAFANRPGGTRPQMATAARVEAHVALLPLLAGRVEIAAITLVRPDILLETDDNGIGNWQVQRPAAPAAATDAAPHRAREPIVIRSILVENGRVTWHDGRTGWTQAVDLQRAAVAVAAMSTTIAADAQASGQPAHLDATLGAPAQLTGAAAGPFPVKLALRFGDASFSLDGAAQLPIPAHGFQGRVTADVPNLAALGPVLQRALPDAHDLRLDMTMTGETPSVQAATLHIGAADLSRIQPGAALTRLDLDYPAPGQPARLEAEGTLANAPWRLASSLLRSGTGVSLRGLDLQSALIDMQGDVAVTQAPRPAIRGTLVSHHLDVDALRSLPRAAEPAPVPGPAAPAPAPSTALFSTAPLPWAALRRLDADLQMTIDTLHVAHADYRAATAHLVLNDGALRLDPASMQAPGGRVDGALTADAAQPQPPVTLALRSAALALDPLAQAFGLPGGSNATVELDVALQSAGASPHDLAAHLDGHAGLAMVDGELSDAMVAALLGPLGRSVGVKLGRSHVRCLAVRVNLAQGQASLAALRLDTALLDLEGTGVVDLGAETLALRLRPTIRAGGVGVVTPVRLDGPLARPVLAQGSLDPAGRVGVAIGNLAPAQDSCTAALTAARDGRAGPLPADAPSKAAKPADLLRSFLR